MIWGCLSFKRIGTLTDVKGNINSQIYIDVLENKLWLVIARHFADNEYVFQDDNAPVHRARITENYKQENDINCTTWPAQSQDLNVCENVWLRIKRALQNNRWKYQHPKRTCYRNSTCMGKSLH